MQAYSNPKRESDPHSLPDVEVFHISGQQEYEQYANGEDNIQEAGWYYWYCFPGCLPDSEPMGPFATEAEALTDAQDTDGYDDDDPLCGNCRRPASEHSDGDDDFSKCPA